MKPFDATGPYGTLRGSIAADFTVSTTDGSWTYSEQRSGCDVVVFVPEADESTRGWPTPLWDRDLRKLIERSPRNVHWFFFPTEGQPKQATNALTDDIEDKLGKLDAEDAEHWRPRLHAIDSMPSDWGDWLADKWAETGYGWAIGRHQELRDIGSFADYERYDGGAGWFEPNLSYAANEAVYLNFAADRADALAAQTDVTIVEAFDGSPVGGSATVDVAFPDAATMAGFDTLELDLELTCDGPREFGYCGAWDYLVYLHQCDVPTDDANPWETTPCQPHVPGVTEVLEELGDCAYGGVGGWGTSCRSVGDCPPSPPTRGTGDTGTTPTTGTWSCDGYVAPVAPVTEVPADTQPCTCTDPLRGTEDRVFTCSADGTGYDACGCACDTEVGRWITAYHREGRWVHDATPMLAYLKGGGTQRLRFSTSQTYGVHLDFRLRNTGRGAVPDDLTFLYAGGTFVDTYNDAYETLLVDVPADAKRVELVAVITGHGFGANLDNCAEFCNHTHHFTVNGTPFTKEHPEADIEDGCVQQVADGTIPNQFGTWFYGRGGWCPGMEAAPWVVDVTDAVTPGTQAAITYEGRLGGEPYVHRPDSGTFQARIDMISYLHFAR